MKTTKTEVVIVSNHEIIYTKTLRPGKNRLNLDAIILSKQLQDKAKEKAQHEQITKQAKDFNDQLAKLPYHQRVSHIIKNVIAPALKPPNGLV